MKHQKNNTLYYIIVFELNMSAIIAAHNTKMLSGKCVEGRGCNCQEKLNCLLRGKCFTKSVVYRVDFKVENGTKYYIGLTKGEIKDRYREHKNSFCNSRKKSSSTLASFVWKNGKNATNTCQD